MKGSDEPQHYPNPVDDPEFYCHGQTCIDNGCSPLFCADEDGEGQ